ncbi:MAG: hypothetical protein DRQ42_00180 [Gammaproteobacteria bacterium]|nr:MAG: hypothetical protein DRQ42_00180 [Gammaproteobacteria bacterium]
MTLSFTDYRYKPVFHVGPIWEESPGKLSRNRTDIIGTTFGYTYSEPLSNFPNYSTNFIYNFVGKEDISVVNGLFDSLKGRIENIWFPSWIADFKINGDIASTDTTIDVLTTENYSVFYPPGRGTGRYLFIYVNDSIWFARRLTGYTATKINIDSALGRNIPKSQVKFISFLYMGRLDLETIEWMYSSPEVASTKLYFVELPNEYTSTTTTTA